MTILQRHQGMLGSELSVDLGTANTLVYVRGRGIVLNEPSMVAIRRDSSSGIKTVLAIGEGTKQMLGRTPPQISALQPLKGGVVADFAMTATMLRYFLHKVLKGRLPWSRPQILICVPSGATLVERRAIKECAAGAGASKVFVIEEPLAAAIGAGLPVSEPRGSMVLDIGGGTAEAAVISCNSIVCSRSVRAGGDCFDDAIIQHVRRSYGIVIGELSAERIKLSIGSAWRSEEPLQAEVKGHSPAKGIPERCRLNSDDVRAALQEPLESITDAVRSVLEEVPPDLAADVAERGIVLTGGGALLRGIDRFVAKETGLSVRLADDPTTCVARGSGRALEMGEEDRRILFAG